MIKNIVNKFIIEQYKLKYLIFSIISGILLALSFQKFNFFFLAWIAFVPLIYCIYKNDLKFSALYSFITGIMYSIIAFNWMYLFLLKNTSSFSDSCTISMIVWICLSLYFVVWGIGINFIKKKNKITLILFAPALWVSLEYIRNYYFGSFPINLLGYSQSSVTQVIQFADIFGVFGISFIIMLINVLLFCWICNREKKYLLIVIFVVCSMFVYGYIRINQISQINNEKEIKIGIVQPNIEQKYKFKKRYVKKILYDLKQAGISLENKNLDIVLYPETVLPKNIKENQDVKNFVNNISPWSNYTLIGGFDVENYKVYNSIFVVSNVGEVIDSYRKKHLILFGEYVPFEGLLAKMFSKFITDNNLTKEIELKAFTLDKCSLGINICSENYYPYLSRELVLKGANLLTTHSNDAWCDGLSYPYQHFVLNIFRAIENRKYLIVASNTGISGVIAPTGKIVRQTKNQEQIVLEETVYTNNYITIYDKIGDLFVYLCMAYAVIILLFFFFRTKNKSSR